jgi:uncharacterized protein
MFRLAMTTLKSPARGPGSIMTKEKCSPIVPIAKIALAWLALLLITGIARADPPVPALSGRVVDLAHVLDPATAQRITAELANFEKQNQIQLVVVTLPDLAGYTIEDWGLALGRSWGIGQKGKNNGVLLVVAPKDRQLRIEVGYGLEGDLPDATANRIIQDTIVPRFRRGELAFGIEAGAQAIIKALGGQIQGSEIGAPASPEPGSTASGFPAMLVFLIFFVFIMMLNHRRRSPWTGYYPYYLGRGGFGRGGGFSGGGFSSGGFSGGGGSFGGGGASGRW